MIVNSSFSFDIFNSLAIATLYSLWQFIARKIQNWISGLNSSKDIIMILRIISSRSGWLCGFISFILDFAVFDILICVVDIIIKSVSIVIILLLIIFSWLSI